MSSALRSALLVSVWLLATAAPALASGGDEGGNPWVEFMWEALNLALLVGVIVYFARSPVREFFAGRREQIKGELESAASVLGEAEARFAEWEQKLGALDIELVKIRETERRRAQQERARILEDAREAALRIERDAKTSILREQRRAQAALQREAGELAVEMAAGILRETMQDEDRDRLVDEFIGSIEASHATGSGS